MARRYGGGVVAKGGPRAGCLVSHLTRDRGATQRKLEGPYEEDRGLSSEAGPEEAATALDHEDEEIVLVGPRDDDDGAVHSTGERRPEATGAEDAATTQAAEAKKLERADLPSDRIRPGPPEERRCLSVKRRVECAMENDESRRPNGGRESLDHNMRCRVVYGCIIFLILNHGLHCW